MFSHIYTQKWKIYIYIYIYFAPETGVHACIAFVHVLLLLKDVNSEIRGVYGTLRIQSKYWLSLAIPHRYQDPEVRQTEIWHEGEQKWV